MISKISNMQGTPAFLEYLKPKDEHRRSKKKCIHYKNGTCMSKTARFMTQCTSPTFCNQYREGNVEYKKINNNYETDKINKNLVSKSNSKTITGDKDKTISLYCNVKIMDYSDNKKILNITIVPKDESDFISNKISVESELGKTLIGKKKGDKIYILVVSRNGKGYDKYEVLEFE